MNWIKTNIVLSDPYEAAILTVISSASEDPENREELKSILETQFAKAR